MELNKRLHVAIDIRIGVNLSSLMDLLYNSDNIVTELRRTPKIAMTIEE